ncbi:MAG: hypothetical protein ACOC54_02025, partial [Candidatus Sumerlaeota bacterium]
FESFSKMLVSFADLMGAYAHQARKGAFDLGIGLLLAALAVLFLGIALLLGLAALTLAIYGPLGLPWALLISGVLCAIAVTILMWVAHKYADGEGNR